MSEKPWYELMPWDPAYDDNQKIRADLSNVKKDDELIFGKSGINLQKVTIENVIKTITFNYKNSHNEPLTAEINITNDNPYNDYL